MIIAFTGAGISQASGIRSFMEQPEIREKLFRRYAVMNPEDYKKTITTMCETIDKAEPNDAHRALAEYNIPIITMNIDGLHEKAGSNPLTLHGTLPSQVELSYADQLFNKPVLYGDPAPNYHKAYQKISNLKEGDTLLVIGASRFTGIAVDLREIAYENRVNIIEIQEDAEHETRRVLETLFKDN